MIANYHRLFIYLKIPALTHYEPIITTYLLVSN